MNVYDFDPLDRSGKCKVHHNSDDKIHLVSPDEPRLQMISTRVPLSRILSDICGALDCQIGNVVSLISLPWDEVSDLAAIALNAGLFGLHTFCSEGIVTDNDELLGSLEMYCSVPRGPSASESEMIERAKRLAAIAIELDGEAGRPGNCGLRGNRPVRGHVLDWPASKN